MFRLRAKHSVLVPVVTALLLTGCGGGDSEPTETQEPSPTTPSSEESPTATNTAAALEELNKQLGQAAEQAGPEGFGAIVCESVQGGVLAVQNAGKEATAEGLRQILSNVLEGARRSDESLQDADIDATTKQQCPEVRADALKAAGVNNLEDLLAG